MKKSLLSKFKSLIRNKAFRMLSLSSILMMIVLYTEQHFYPASKELIQLNAYGRTSVIAIFIFLIIFIAFERRALFNIKEFKINWRIFLLVAPIHLLLFLGFWSFKRTIINEPFLLEQSYNLLVFIRYFIPFAMIITLLLMFFDNRFLKLHLKALSISFVVSVVFFQISLLFRNYWLYFSTATTKAVAWLLGLSFGDVFADYASQYGPALGAGGFTAYIQSPCSGIEGMSLFLFLYILIAIIDRRELNWVKTVTMGVLGLLGMFMVNILRIYTLYLVAIYYNPRIAISYFHTNAGWILFITYFVIFWYLIYYFIRKDKFK